MGWQAVHDLQSPTIQCIGNSHVPVSRAQTKTFVVTRGPASRHIRAPALSRANPRLPKIPALEQAARWWPRAWSGRPHRHLRRAKGKGRRRWRRRSDPSIRVCMLHDVVWRATPSCWATLRAHQRQLTVREKWEVLRHSEILFHAGRGLVLPSAPVPLVRSPLVLLEAVELHESMQTKKEGTTKPGTPANRSAATATAFRQVMCGCSSNRA